MNVSEVEDEKKSMSFPIVNGTSMDTELETRSNPIAYVNCFFSGLANSISFLTLLVDPSSGAKEDGRNRLKRETRFAGRCAIAVESVSVGLVSVGLVVDLVSMTGLEGVGSWEMVGLVGCEAVCSYRIESAWDKIGEAELSLQLGRRPR